MLTRLRFGALALTTLFIVALRSSALADVAPAGRSNSCDTTIFAHMRAATGGAAWPASVVLTAVGNAGISSLHGTARFDTDLQTGKHAERFNIAIMGKTASVFDGSTSWVQDGSGGVHALDSTFARELGVTDAYLARRGYLSTDSLSRSECRGARTESGKSFVVIRVTPRDGVPADLWIDPTTYLLASVREVMPTTIQVTRYGDYRQVGALVLPFSIQSGSVAEPADGFSFNVASYSLHRERTADFLRPLATNVAFMRKNVRSTTVPIALEGQQLLIWASIDGHQPMAFILDTGGHAILTTTAARSLGLSTSGAGESGGSGAGTTPLQFTTVNSLRIGDAVLRNQPFLVIPYPYSFYERGRRAPLAGILGLEVFERFATRIDYGARRVTLTPLTSFRYDGRGSVVPLRFQADIPLIPASADGRPGTFGVDTGNSGTLILFGPYLARNGFLERYRAGAVMQGRGTGGTNTGTSQKLERFAIGGHTFRDLSAYFATMKSGSFASTTEAGNIGYEVLSRFVPTFDYAAETMYLDASSNLPPLRDSRAGMGFFKNGPSAFDVVFVAPGSPAAAAGIAVGDKITAVDGMDATNLSRADFFDMVRRAPGTRLSLRVLRGSASRDVVLVLK
jgi:predicted aspartyl protease